MRAALHVDTYYVLLQEDESKKVYKRFDSSASGYVEDHSPDHGPTEVHAQVQPQQAKKNDCSSAMVNPGELPCRSGSWPDMVPLKSAIHTTHSLPTFTAEKPASAAASSRLYSSLQYYSIAMQCISTAL